MDDPDCEVPSGGHDDLDGPPTKRQCPDQAQVVPVQDTDSLFGKYLANPANPALQDTRTWDDDFIDDFIRQVLFYLTFLVTLPQNAQQLTFAPITADTFPADTFRDVTSNETVDNSPIDTDAVLAYLQTIGWGTLLFKNVRLMLIHCPQTGKKLTIVTGPNGTISYRTVITAIYSLKNIRGTPNEHWAELFEGLLLTEVAPGVLKLELVFDYDNANSDSSDDTSSSSDEE